ncbi:unnamed protein product, partial [Meganyctiphanes norvegica]
MAGARVDQRPPRPMQDHGSTALAAPRPLRLRSARQHVPDNQGDAIAGHHDREARRRLAYPRRAANTVGRPAVTTAHTVTAISAKRARMGRRLRRLRHRGPRVGGSSITGKPPSATTAGADPGNASDACSTRISAMRRRSLATPSRSNRGDAAAAAGQGQRRVQEGGGLEGCRSVMSASDTSDDNSSDGSLGVILHGSSSYSGGDIKEKSKAERYPRALRPSGEIGEAASCGWSHQEESKEAAAKDADMHDEEDATAASTLDAASGTTQAQKYDAMDSSSDR